MFPLYTVPFLKEMREKYKDKGLQVITLSYEMSGDPARDEETVAAFRKAHDIPWETVIKSSSFEDAETTLPKEIENGGSYPLLIFIHPDGKVEKMHSGFNSPSAGELYTQLVSELSAATAAIVGS